MQTNIQSAEQTKNNQNIQQFILLKNTFFKTETNEFYFIDFDFKKYEKTRDVFQSSKIKRIKSKTIKSTNGNKVNVNTLLDIASPYIPLQTNGKTVEHYNTLEEQTVHLFRYKKKRRTKQINKIISYSLLAITLFFVIVIVCKTFEII